MTLRPHFSVQGWPGDLHQDGEQGHGYVSCAVSKCVLCSLLSCDREALSGWRNTHWYFPTLREFVLGPRTVEQLSVLVLHKEGSSQQGVLGVALCYLSFFKWPLGYRSKLPSHYSRCLSATFCHC